jgi:type VI secretion system protein
MLQSPVGCRPASAGAARGAALALLCVLLLSGCNAVGSAMGAVGGWFKSEPRPVSVAWRSLAVSATDDANQNSPVAVDIVFVSAPAVLEALLAMPAQRWFATRSDLRRSFPEAVSVISLEIVPRQSVLIDPRQLAVHRALAVIVYADYVSPGDHRARLSTQAAGYLLQMGGKGFAAVEAR